jgi:hypothetical protein
MREFASLYFLIRHTFVTAVLFLGINLDSPYFPKQSCTHKSGIIAEI